MDKALRTIIVALLLSMSAHGQILRQILEPQPVAAAGITFDAVSNATPVVAQTTLSWSHTVGSGTNRVLVVVMGSPGSNKYGTAACTWNTSESMTKITAKTDGAGATNVVAFILKNPTSGSHTISCTSLTSADHIGGATSWAGVNQTTPNRSSFVANDGGSAAASPTSIAVTNAVSGDVVLDVTMINTTPMAGGGTTVRYQVNNPSGDGVAFGHSSTPASGSTTVQWTYTGTTFWCAIGFALVPA